jgi:hypothetical protein
MEHWSEIGVFVLSGLLFWGRIERRFTILETKMEAVMEKFKHNQRWHR